MSRRSTHSHYYDYSGHRSDTRSYPAAAAAPATAPRDYTFAHAGRQVRLGPVAFWVVVGTLVIMALWTITTGTYFAFRDDVLTRLIARQANMQFGYEDRVAELRAQIDRISSRQLLDQELYEQKLEQVLQRQSTLESRATAVGGLPDPLTTGSIKPAGKKGDAARTPPLKAGSDKGAFLLQSTSMQTVSLDQLTAPAAKKSAGNVDAKLARLQASLDRVEQSQGSTLGSLEESLEYKARRLRGVLVDLGFEKGKGNEVKVAGIGGPFLPVKSASEGGGFDRQLSRIRLARANVERLTRTLNSLPVRKPLSGELEIASSFGVRNDPFTRSAAMHTGLDFQSEQGAPVRVTANRHGDRRGLERRLRQGDRRRSRQRLRDPLRPPLGHRRQGRPDRACRPGDRPGRFDRAVDRAASALRDTHRQGAGRSGEIPPRRQPARRPSVVRRLPSPRAAGRGNSAP